MSEFKYACPVCGQHIKCDSSQAGSQMECPTCFQKITVPQAPSTEEQKFILTGTKKSDRPVPTIPESSSSAAAAAKGFPGALVVVLILLFIGGAVAFVYRGTIFKSKDNSTAVASDTTDESSQTPASTPKPPKPPKPAPVAPPASDTNWTLALEGVTIPDSTAAGRIHGQDFIVERAMLQNGTLTLREGRNGSVTFGLMINFGGAQPEALAGQSLDVTTNAPMAARITMAWQDAGQNAKENIEGGYAMRLTFGQLAGNRLPGRIYFCAPDELKSYVAGTFNVQIRRPKPQPPKS
jgi:DNA-directed RNA polymerase subunit RPC12/RpoP